MSRRGSRWRRCGTRRRAGSQSAQRSRPTISVSPTTPCAPWTPTARNPPLRSEDDRQALIEGLRDGTIACIATDHAPHARHEKETPFEEAPFGVTGLETAFAALNTFLVEPGTLDLGTVLERMSAGPARVFGLPVPRIEVGERANLVLIDLDATWRVGEGGFRSKSTNSWLLGETLRGSIVKTVADGRVVHAS